MYKLRRNVFFKIFFYLNTCQLSALQWTGKWKDSVEIICERKKLDYKKMCEKNVQKIKNGHGMNMDKKQM